MISFENIKTIGVVGAGTMGQGIAQICAQAGYQTILFDINAPVLDKATQTTETNLSKAVERGKLSEEDKAATLERLRFTRNMTDVIADIIIEAVVERLEVKHSIFQELAMLNGSETILASNTSSIPITRIAAKVAHPGRVVGMHFFNP